MSDVFNDRVVSSVWKTYRPHVAVRFDGVPKAKKLHFDLSALAPALEAIDRADILFMWFVQAIGLLEVLLIIVLWVDQPTPAEKARKRAYRESTAAETEHENLVSFNIIGSQGAIKIVDIFLQPVTDH
jgi:hypothetical protein